MKQLLLLIFATALCAGASAQGRHEVSFYGGGGVSTLRYSPAVGSSSWSAGGELGFGYAYRFHTHWEVLTGLGVSLHRASAGINGVELIDENQHDTDGFPFNFHTTLSGHSESQRAFLLNIPLLARFSAGRYYAHAGVTLGIPLSASYRTAEFALADSGTYPSPYGVSGALTDPTLGFGPNQEGVASSGALSLRVSLSASLEAGLRWQLAPRWRLYTGVYLDYGLTNAASGAEIPQPLVPYHAAQPTPYAANSVLQSKYVDKFSPLALGAIVRIALSSAPTKLDDALDVIDPLCKGDTVYITDTVFVTKTLIVTDTVVVAGDTIIVTDTIVISPPAPVAVVAPEDTLIIIDNYGCDLSGLSPGAKRQLAPLLEELQIDTSARVVAEGHTCDKGRYAINVRVGLRRADVVAQYLRSHGVAPARLKTLGKANTEPRVPNISEKNRRINRRVVVRIVRKKDREKWW
jgi:hypothetical protein